MVRGGRAVKPRRAICDLCFGMGESWDGHTCPDCEGAGIINLPVEDGGYELPDEPPPGWCEVER